MSATITQTIETAAETDFLHRVFTGFDTSLAGQDSSAVIVAVSGGSDSLALLLLTRDYLAKKMPDCRLIAVTVDHQLRDESAKEAQDVAALCKGLGIPHQTLCWEGDKPASGVASAARAARYDLLVQVAQQCNATIILTGHTADDQVETYLMRRERETEPAGIVGEGRGLAAMATQTLLQNTIMLCRPLLSLWREELRGFLRGKNIVWADDPSNENTAYERPRIRQFVKTLDKAVLFAEAVAAAQKRRTDNHRVADLLTRACDHSTLLSGDGLLLSAGWNVQAEDLTPLTLAYLLAAIGGQSFLPSLQDCAVLADWLQVPPPGAKQRRTLHHCVIEVSSNGMVIRRERRNLPVVRVQSGQQALWDGRYLIRNKTDAVLDIAAPDERQLSAYLHEHEIESTQAQRDIWLSAPAIFRDGCLMEIPALSRTVPQSTVISLERILACFDRVLSGHDFAVALAVKALLTMHFNHNCR